MKALHAAACLVLLAAPGAVLGQKAPAPAPAPPAEDDITNRIINLPPPSAYRVDGAKGKQRQRRRGNKPAQDCGGGLLGHVRYS